MIISNLQAKVEKLELEGDKLRAQLEKKSPAKKAATSKATAKKPARKLLLRRPHRLLRKKLRLSKTFI